MTMTEKERLIILLGIAMYEAVPKAKKAEDKDKAWYEGIADYLLASGVHAPPIKVGDTVYTNVSWQGWYLRNEDRPYKAKVVFIGINEEGGFMNVVYEKNDNMLTFTFDEIGDRIFLTREEAEKALKE